MESIKIIQHKEGHWKTNKNNLIQNYRHLDPDTLLLNSHGLKDEETLRIQGYKTHKINRSRDLLDGSAILVKQYISYNLTENFITDMLAIQVDTIKGPINIATTYLPPRRPYLPFPDVHKIMSYDNPSYLVGDLNANHRFLGHNTNNNVGRGLKRLHDDNKIVHLGPNFSTYISGTKKGTPDIILGNREAVA